MRKKFPKNYIFGPMKGALKLKFQNLRKKHSQGLYSTYVSNFNFLAQFGGETCEKQTQKIRNTDQKHTILGGHELVQ